MARYRYLIGIVVFLLIGCAQVGTISGGDEDLYAPKPIENEVSPANASTFFTSKKVEIPFDEYFKLNKPSQNIQMVPPHAKIHSEIKGKTLYLNWEEELEPNTTYAIYLNRAVKDLSEGNDSIMQYVFSTGPILDSLTYTVSAVDAWTNTAKKNVLVGLYNPIDGSILNFGQTDQSGLAKLRYLKAREYMLIAFEDENGDLIHQPDETVGFFDDSLIQIDSTISALKPFRMFTPSQDPEIVSAKFTAPSKFIIELSRPIKNEELYLDGVLQSRDQYNLLTPNTLELFVESNKLLASGEIIYKDYSFSDTVSYRVLDAQKKGDITIKAPNNGVYAPSDSVKLLVNDIITELDGRLMSVRHLGDSSLLSTFIGHTKNEITFVLDRKKTSSYLIHFDAGAVKTVNGESPAFDITIRLNSLKRYGTFSLDLSYYTKTIILQVIRGKILVKEQTFLAQELENRIIVPELSPGSYTFKVVHDDNYNGQWDVGNLKLRKQPERVDIYSTPSKIRANWEVEVQLIPKSENP